MVKKYGEYLYKKTTIDPFHSTPLIVKTIISSLLTLRPGASEKDFIADLILKVM